MEKPPRGKAYILHQPGQRLSYPSICVSLPDGASLSCHVTTATWEIPRTTEELPRGAQSNNTTVRDNRLDTVLSHLGKTEETNR